MVKPKVKVPTKALPTKKPEIEEVSDNVDIEDEELEESEQEVEVDEEEEIEEEELDEEEEEEEEEGEEIEEEEGSEQGEEYEEEETLDSGDELEAEVDEEETLVVEEVKQDKPKQLLLKKKPTKANAKPKNKAAASGIDETKDATGNEDELTFVILTKPGTSLAEFKALVKKLGPIGQNGREVVYPDLDFQMYVTPLDTKSAKVVGSSDIVYCCVENVRYAPESDTNKKQKSKATASTSKKKGKGKTTATTSKGKGKQKATASNTEEQDPAPNHLKLLSQPSEGEESGYIYNEEAGEGVTIFVIDTGVRASHVEFSNREPETDIIGFAQTGDRDTDPTPQFNHGTTVMSAAGGNEYGASKKANLHMIKIDHRVTLGKVKPLLQRPSNAGKTDEEIRKTQAKDTASQIAQFGLSEVLQSFQLVISKVKENKNLVSQAVVNFSIGFKVPEFEPDAERKSLLQKLLKLFKKPKDPNPFVLILDKFRELDIVCVTSSGNSDAKGADRPEISENHFKKLATTTELIVVGGVNEDLSPWAGSVEGPEVTVRAQASKTNEKGDGVEYASIEDDNATVVVHGTSQASGIVSGLVANLLSNAELKVKLRGRKGQVAKRVKNYLVATASVREFPEDTDAAELIACNGEAFTEEEKAERDRDFIARNKAK